MIKKKTHIVLLLASFSSISTIVGPFSPMRTNMAMF